MSDATRDSLGLPIDLSLYSRPSPASGDAAFRARIDVTIGADVGLTDVVVLPASARSFRWWEPAGLGRWRVAMFPTSAALLSFIATLGYSNVTAA